MVLLLLHVVVVVVVVVVVDLTLPIKVSSTEMRREPLVEQSRAG